MNNPPKIHSFGRFAGSNSNHLISTIGKECSDCGIKITTEGGTIFATPERGAVYICCGINQNACAQKRIMLIGGHDPRNESFQAMAALRKKVKDAIKQDL